MAKTVNIINGTGTVDLINDTYSVSVTSSGYDSTTLEPTTITTTEQTNSYSFTVAAEGTLTLHVTEDGTTSSTPIVGATFIRCDSAGNEYGSPITTNSEGDAVFANVPYADSLAPAIYFKQTASDGDHEFSNALQNTTMTTSSETLQITNAKGAVRTITLTDANYANLEITSATLTLTN